MRARDVMSRPVVTLRPDDRIERALVLMTSRNITSVPVVDASAELVGIVSEVDLLPHPEPAAPPGRQHHPKVVADVMTEDVVAVAPEADLSEVAKAMVDYEVRCVPVVADAEVVGVVSRRDVLRSMVHSDDVVSSEVQSRLDDYAGWQRRWTVTLSNGVAVVSGSFDDEVQRKVVEALVQTVPGVTGVEMLAR